MGVGVGVMGKGIVTKWVVFRVGVECHVVSAFLIDLRDEGYDRPGS